MSSSRCANAHAKYVLWWMLLMIMTPIHFFLNCYCKDGFAPKSLIFLRTSHFSFYLPTSQFHQFLVGYSCVYVQKHFRHALVTLVFLWVLEQRTAQRRIGSFWFIGAAVYLLTFCALRTRIMGTSALQRPGSHNVFWRRALNPNAKPRTVFGRPAPW